MPTTTTAVGDGLDDVRRVLARSTYDNNTLTLPAELLVRDVWELLHATLTGMGARGGSRRGQPYRFETDRFADLERFIAGGPAPLHEKKKAGWVRTPQALADDVLARFAELDALPAKPRVLEPSAGDGSLIRALLAAVPAAEVTAVEPVTERAASVKQISQVYPMHVCTLEQYAERFGSGGTKPFDLVIMNPPYSVPGNRTIWVDHVKLAWGMLAEGGRLVAIVPGTADERRRDRNIAAVLEFLGPDAVVEQLPAKSFHQYGADVSTCVVAATKQVSSVQRARARYAMSLYRQPVFDMARAVRVEEPKLSGAAAVNQPMQVCAGFAGDERIVYVGKCIVCSVSTWTDGRNDPRGMCGLNALSLLRPEENGLEGPEVIMCAGCGQSGIMWQRGMDRARTMWVDPECEPDVEPYQPMLFDLEAMGVAVAAALAAL